MKDKIQSSQRLEGFLSRLLVLSETYPQLKANESFLKLQDSLEGTENRIAVERKRYNDDVRILNTYRRSAFGRFFASLAGVNEATYYEIPQAEKEAPKVKFNSGGSFPLRGSQKLLFRTPHSSTPFPAYGTFFEHLRIIALVSVSKCNTKGHYFPGFLDIPSYQCHSLNMYLTKPSSHPARLPAL